MRAPGLLQRERTQHAARAHLKRTLALTPLTHQNTASASFYSNAPYLFACGCSKTGDFRRHVEEQAQAPFYAYQWLYLPVLYGFLGILTRIQDYATTYADRSAGPIRVNYYGHPLVHLVAPKLLWAVYRVAIPLIYFRVPHAVFWPCLAITELATGFYLAWNFEVSHVADTVDFLVAREKEGGRRVLHRRVKAAGEGSTSSAAQAGAEEEPRLEPISWAEAQVLTGVDYAHNSWWNAWWSGALNYQIEHHLFPGISQYHYPAISSIVKQCCEEYKLNYTLEPTFWSAWTAHVRLLQKMGAQGREFVPSLGGVEGDKPKKS